MPIVGLIVLCAVAILGAPRLLTIGTWQIRHPQMAMTLWHFLFAAGLCGAAVTMVWSVWVAVDANASSHDHNVANLLPLIMVIAGWVSLGVLGATIALVMQRAETMVVDDRDAYGNVATLLDVATYQTLAISGTSVAFVDVQAPIAFAAPGINVIVISSFVADTLSPRELWAVIEHEHTHLLQRHGWSKRLTRLNSACLPGLMAAEKFERATSMLVELIADDRAVRICGHEAVASALHKLAVINGNESMQLRADRITGHRCSGRHPTALPAPEILKALAGEPNSL